MWYFWYRSIQTQFDRILRTAESNSVTLYGHDGETTSSIESHDSSVADVYAFFMDS